MSRPKSFDTDQALLRAIDLFWAKGYEATHMQDLLDHMGISRQSCYDTFGDKHQLYLQALRRYGQVSFEEAFSNLTKPAANLSDIQQLFCGLVDHLADQMPRRACLILNAAVERAPHDPAVADIVRGYFDRMSKAFTNALTNAQKQKQLKNDKPIPELAQYLTALVNGLGVMGKGGARRRDLHAVVDIALSQLG